MKVPEDSHAQSLARVFKFALICALTLLAADPAPKFTAADSSAARRKENPTGVATIDSISPSQGPIAGGTQVTLNGSGFTGTTLTLDGVAITPQSASETQIVFITPAHDNGIASVQLSGNGPNAYAEFLYVPPALKDLPPGYITTVMGIGQFYGNGRLAKNAMVTTGASELAFSKDGTLYICEPNQFTVRRLRLDGIIEAFAGGVLQEFGRPLGLEIDPDGNIISSDASSIRRIDINSRAITIIAGSQTAGFSGDGGPATAAQFSSPNHIAYDGSGNLYILDWDNVRIRRIGTNGIVTTIAGKGVVGFSGDGGPATQAAFDIGGLDGGGLAADPQGNVYLADSHNGRVRRIDVQSGIISTFANGVGDVEAVTTDKAGNVYVGNNNYDSALGRLLEFSPGGMLLRSWGKGLGFSPDDAAAANAAFGNIQRIKLDKNGNIVFAEYDSSRLRRIDVTSGLLETVAGIGPHIIGEIGPALATPLNDPGTDLLLLPTGEMLTAEGSNYLVRRIDLQGNVSDFAGNGLLVFKPTSDNVPALQVPLYPVGLGLAPDGSIVIVNSGGDPIVRVNTANVLHLVTANPAGFSGDGGPASLAEVAPYNSQVAFDKAGNLFIADSGNNRIRRVDAQTSIITTVVGNGTKGYCGDGGPAIQACLDSPQGIAIDTDGSLYISEYISDDHRRVREVDKNGVITTFNEGYSQSSIFDSLHLALNLSHLFTAVGCRIEPNGHRYCYSFQGAGKVDIGDGGPANQAKFWGTLTTGVAVDSDGNLFLADGGNRRIRAIRFGAVIAEPGSTVSATAGMPQTTPAGTTFPVALQVTLKSPAGTLENGIRVDFSAPTSGASCTFLNGSTTYSVLTDINGYASATCTANSQTGSYAVLATPLTLGQSASFSLSNVTPPTIQFNSASYVVTEGTPRVDITLARTGITSNVSSVRYATSDGTAKEGKDYTSAFGVLDFAAGETSKTFPVLIIDNAFAVGTRTANLTLSNPIGATLSAQSTAVLNITDNDASNGTTNPIDQSRFFVQLHYYDFLGRYPDQGGWDFWTNNIDNCTPKPSCIDAQRINTSAAYFLSIEFQQTGYLVERIYKTAYGSASATSTFGGMHQFAVPIVRFSEFLPDTQQIGAGVVVGQGDWQTALENNKQAFTSDFVQRSRFTTAFPTTMTPAQFVDKLNQNADNVLSASDRTTLIALFGSATDTGNTTARAQAVRQVAENATLNTQEFNRAFVLMQYFGYLRRDPNNGQDTDYTGFDFWLTKLNQFNGNYNAAEMVKAFITSTEYRQRFGP